MENQTKNTSVPELGSRGNVAAAPFDSSGSAQPNSGGLFSQAFATRQAPKPPAPRPPRDKRARWIRRGAIATAILILIGGGIIFVLNNNQNNALLSADSANVAERFDVLSIPLNDLVASSPLVIDASRTLSVNGQLKLNNGLVVAPGDQPVAAVAGQIYYDQGVNQLRYYNGTEFVGLITNVPDSVTSVGGATGALTLGGGLAQNGALLSNTGVLTLQGQAGNVALTAGPGVVVNGTTISSSGILSFGGTTGDITVGSGLGLSGGELRNTGVVSVASSSSSLVVTNDGNGNITLANNGAGTGTIDSPGGTAGRIAKFTGVQTIADSLLSESGSVVTVNGSLSVTSDLTLGTALTVANGGTGSTNAAGARSNLGTAASGANNDITSLSGLTTPLSIAQGGTGAVNAPNARSNLGAAASGANSDITSLSGLTTALSVSQGGIGVGTLATNGVLVGNGASAVTSVVAGGSGLCLLSTGGAPSWQACPSSGGSFIQNQFASAQSANLFIANAGSTSDNTATFRASSSQTGHLLEFQDSAGSSVGFVATDGSITSSGAINIAGNFQATSASSLGALGGSTVSNQRLTLYGGSSTKGLVIQAGSSQGTSLLDITTSTGQLLSSFDQNGQLQLGRTGASGLQGTLKFADGSSAFVGTLLTTTLTANHTYTLPDVGGIICTNGGNCAGVGGGVTTAGGTTNKLAKFTASQAIGDSIITDNGSTVTIAGDLSVTGTTILSTPLSVSSGGTGASSLAANGVVVGNGTGVLSSVTAGGANLCLVSTGGAPTFSNCNLQTAYNNSTGGTTPEVKLNGTQGSLDIQDADTPSSGNLFNIRASNGAGFGQILLGVSASGAVTLQNSSNSTSAFVVENAAGTPQLTVDTTGQRVVIGTLSTNTITPSSALTVGSTSQSFTLQGNASSSVAATDTGNTTSLIFQTPTANVNYRLLTTAAGTYDICTTAGNCSGVGGGVTTPGGTTNRLAKFSAGQTIADSSITDNGTTVTVAASAVIQGASGLQIGVPSTTTGQLVFANGTNANTLTLQSGTTGSNLTLTLPIADGGSGQCLTTNGSGSLGFADCLSGSGGGSGGVTSLDGLSGVLTVNNATGSGSAITIDDASTIAKGIASFNSTNFSVTAGAVNTIQGIGTSATPTFAGLNLSSALTVGNGGTGVTSLTANGILFGNGAGAIQATSAAANSILATNGSNTPSLTQTLPTAVQGNIIGTGALASGSITTGFGTISTGNNITTTAALQGATATLTGGTSLTLGTASTNTGAIALKNSTNANTLTLQAGATSGNLTFTLPTADGSSGQCLKTNATGTLSFGDCLSGAGGGSGGVSSLNGLSGSLTLANASGVGSTITIDDASTIAKGIASFNSTNFSVTSGAVNTIQGIATSSSPSFAGLTLASALTVANGGTGAATFTTNGILFGNGTGTIQVTGAAANSILVTNGSAIPSLSQTLPSAVQSNITSTGVLTSGSITTGFGTISTGNNITTTAALQAASATLSGANALSLGTTGTNNGGIVFSSSNAASGTVTLQVATNKNATSRTYTLPDSSATTDTICLQTLANCSGSGTTLQNAYTASTGGTTPEIKLDSTRGGLDIQDANTTIGANLLTVRAANGSGLGTSMFQVNSTGEVTIQPTVDAVDAFKIMNTTINDVRVFQVDTANGRVGVNLTATDPSLFGDGLEVNGALRLSGTGSTSQDSFTTPNGYAGVRAKLTIPLFSPGSGQGLVVMGLPSGSGSNTRAISVFDARSANTQNQPAISVYSPDEDKLVGFSWDGSSAVAKVKTLNAVTTANSPGLMMQSGTVNGTSLSSGAVTIISGDGGGTNSSSGNIIIDSGTKTGSGTTGNIQIAPTNATSTTVGAGGTTQVTIDANRTFLNKRLRLGVDALTVADNAAGGSPATSTYTPGSSYSEITCNDADGCNITMSEASASRGDTLTILNPSANNVVILKTANVTELAGAANVTLGQYDTISLIYMTDRWVQTAASNN